MRRDRGLSIGSAVLVAWLIIFVWSIVNRDLAAAVRLLGLMALVGMFAVSMAVITGDMRRMK